MHPVTLIVMIVFAILGVGMIAEEAEKKYNKAVSDFIIIVGVTGTFLLGALAYKWLILLAR